VALQHQPPAKAYVKYQRNSREAIFKELKATATSERKDFILPNLIQLQWTSCEVVLTLAKHEKACQGQEIIKECVITIALL